MDQNDWLTGRFEENRPRLRGVAYRMLGSLSEAEDAVQEAWLRFNRSDAASIDNLAGWLTTVVSRVCLDTLRSRKARREESMDAQAVEPRAMRGEGADPEGEAVLADSAWRSSCMICSPCRSTTSAPSWDVRLARRSSSPAGPAGACGVRLNHRATAERVSAPWSTRSCER